MGHTAANVGGHQEVWHDPEMTSAKLICATQPTVCKDTLQQHHTLSTYLASHNLQGLLQVLA
jgi:hypothetical protein